MVIWITGISGAGKTTLAKYYREKSKKKLIYFDGDEFRKIFRNDIKYTLDIIIPSLIGIKNRTELSLSKGKLISPIPPKQREKKWSFLGPNFFANGSNKNAIEKQIILYVPLILPVKSWALLKKILDWSKVSKSDRDKAEVRYCQ